jgi:hypothetical protein
MSLSSFMKPVSKSGVAYGSADLILMNPRENGYSRKWNIVKKFPGGLFRHRDEITSLLLMETKELT